MDDIRPWIIEMWIQEVSYSTVLQCIQPSNVTIPSSLMSSGQ